MSSIDNRLRTFWLYAQAYNNSKAPSWLVFIQSLADEKTGIVATAATRFLSKMVKHAHTG